MADATVPQLGPKPADMTPEEWSRYKVEAHKDLLKARIKAREGKTEKERGQAQLKVSLARLAKAYQKLDEIGAGVSSDNWGGENVWEYLSASWPGQIIAGAGGTEAQKWRDEIAVAKPGIMAAIKKATGLTGTELNSRYELEFWLDQASDPTKNREVNWNTIADLDERFGDGKIKALIEKTRIDRAAGRAGSKAFEDVQKGAATVSNW